MAHCFFEIYLYTNVHWCNQNTTKYCVDFFSQIRNSLLLFNLNVLLINFRYTKVVLVGMNMKGCMWIFAPVLFTLILKKIMIPQMLSV